MLTMKSKVWLLNSKKTDGRYNKGVVVGIELSYDGLGYMTERQYLSEFKEYRYKVAYVDVCTGRACTEWLHHTDVSKTKPVDAV